MVDGRHLRGLCLLLASAVVAAGMAAAALGAALPVMPAAAASPTAHRAGCGGVQTAYPRHRHGHDRPPLAIGDSTMLLALDRLAAIGYEANAHGCREFGEALALIAGPTRRWHAAAHGRRSRSAPTGAISRADIGRTLGLLCCTHLLVLVTPRELGGGSGRTRPPSARRSRGTATVRSCSTG